MNDRIYYALGAAEEWLKRLGVGLTQWGGPDEDGFYPGLFNRYSFPLLAFALFATATGAVLLVSVRDTLVNHLFQGMGGGCLFILGFLMLIMGFNMPKDARPSKVWLITVFGRMRPVKVTGLTFLFNWIPGLNLVGFKEFELKKFDKDIQFKKLILCKDDQYIEGFFSTSFMLDSDDDPLIAGQKPDGWKSGAEKIIDYANAFNDDKPEDVVAQLDDILTIWLQAYADTMPSRELERRSMTIADDLLDCVMGNTSRVVARCRGRMLRNTAGSLRPHTSRLADVRGLGIKFVKFQLIVQALDEVRKARTRIQVQREERKAEGILAETINELVKKRMKLYPKGQEPSFSELRAQILEEELVRQGKASIIKGPGGIVEIKTQQ